MCFVDLRVISPGSNITVSYFGKPVSIEIVEVIGQSCSLSAADSLCEDMDSLNLSANTPVLGITANIITC